MTWTDRINSLMKDREGPYTDNPADRGGKTNWGITENEARAFGYEGDMQEMTQAQAFPIYMTRYVQQPQWDKLGLIDDGLAAHLFDGAVNCGTGTAGTWLQRSLNVLNNQAALWPDLTVDGQCGALTRYALTRLLTVRGDEGRRVILAMVQGLQGAKYIAIAEANPSQEKYEWGWQSQRAFPKQPIA